MRERLALVGVVGILLWSAASARATTYIVQDLGNLGGESKSYSEEINAAGQAAGFRTSAGLDQSFLYTDLNLDRVTDLGEMVYLAPPGGTSSQAYGINGPGQVAGAYYLPSGRQHAYLWDGGAAFQDLGTLGGGNSYASDVNDAGQVSGLADTGAGLHAFLYTDKANPGVTDPGEMQDLGTFGGAESKAYGMNNASQIVGYAKTAAGATHAFLFTDANHNGVRDAGEMQDLGTFGGASSKAYGVNDAGLVVGNWVTAGGQQRAFLWDPVSAAMTDLGGVGANAESINSWNVAVGSSNVGGQLHAVLWQNGAMEDLNSLLDPGSGWVLSMALDINDSGQIVGAGSYDGENVRGFLLTPVPEPFSMIFFGTGLAGVFGFVARRRKQMRA